MSQLGMFDPPAETFVAPPKKTEFMIGLLATWLETQTGSPPNKDEKAILKAAAEQMLIAYQSVLICRQVNSGR